MTTHTSLPQDAAPPSRHSRRAWWLALLFTATLTLAGCGGDPAAAPAARDARPVQVTAVANAPLGAQVHAVGLLAPKDEAKLAFKVGGVIESIRVDEGAVVKRGQVLAQIRQAEIDASVEQARQAAQKASRDLERGKALFADGVATEEQVQDLTTASRVARAALASAEFNARYARIEAPADGVVLRRMAEPNELVQPGQPILLVGGRERGWIVKTSIADRDVVHAMPGDAAVVTFDAYPGRAFDGRVSIVSSAADVATGTFPIEVRVEPGDARFVAGLVAKVALVPRGAQVASVPVVPVRALLEANGDRAFVYVVDPARHVVSRADVRIGRISGDVVEVLGGVTLGQQVVSDGAAFLRDGDAVRVVGPVLAEATR
jgi:RND family efflux transporter MFP subunit